MNYLTDVMKYDTKRIVSFLDENSNMEKAAKKMYDEYENNEDLGIDELKTRDKDWVREYMEEYVKLPEDN